MAKIANGDEAAAALLERGVIVSPLEARLYSVLGILAHGEGRTADAAALFGHALKVLPTEIQALLHTMAYAMTDKRYAEAVDSLELIARRWDGAIWTRVEPALPLLLADPAAFRKVVGRFGASSALRGRLLASLVKSPSTSSYAYDLAIAWNEMGLDVGAEVNQVTQRLIADGNPSGAFLLFRLTRRGAAAEDGGFIHNGEFSRQPSGSAFDWRLDRQPGVSLQLVERRLPGAETGKSEPASLLAIRFLDSPVRFSNVSQTLRLAPGSYRLLVRYAAEALRMPKPVSVTIACEGVRLAEAPFQPGDVGSATLEFDFTVPRGCPLQRVFLFNENVTESWRDRYSGSLFLDSVTLQSRVN